MTYRDDHEAAIERADALERENAELRTELQKRALIPTQPSPVVRPRRSRLLPVIVWLVLLIVFGVTYWLMTR